MPRTPDALQSDEAAFFQPDGYRMELIHQPVEGTERPPLLFVHGSFHAAWCWQEHFLPYFAEAGYESYAVSLRGQGRSMRQEGMKACSLSEHAKDLSNIISCLPRPPVLIGHSFGGLVAQRYITGASNHDSAEEVPPVAGLGLLCAAPASGNDELVKRVAKKSLIMAAKLTWGMISKNFLTNPSACRELFFSKDLPAHDLERFQALLREHASKVPVIDVSRMKSEVPLAAPPQNHPAAFVLGADEDLIVDVQAVEETAALYHVQPHILQNSAHDVMLDTRWREAADALKTWLDTL
ncbi:g8209 [Coccomyxa elongata]